MATKTNTTTEGANMKRIEIDHLNTRDAFNALGPAGSAVGLGYNAGGVSYCWEMSKRADGFVTFMLDGTTTAVGCSLHTIAKWVDEPVTALVAYLVAELTGNDALALCDRIGR
jgi:hypothetical protein